MLIRIDFLHSSCFVYLCFHSFVLSIVVTSYRLVTSVTTNHDPVTRNDSNDRCHHVNDRKKSRGHREAARAGETDRRMEGKGMRRRKVVRMRWGMSCSPAVLLLGSIDALQPRSPPWDHLVQRIAHTLVYKLVRSSFGVASSHSRSLERFCDVHRTSHRAHEWVVESVPHWIVVMLISIAFVVAPDVDGVCPSLCSALRVAAPPMVTSGPNSSATETE